MAASICYRIVPDSGLSLGQATWRLRSGRKWLFCWYIAAGPASSRFVAAHRDRWYAPTRPEP